MVDDLENSALMNDESIPWHFKNVLLVILMVDSNVDGSMNMHPPDNLATQFNMETFNIVKFSLDPDESIYRQPPADKYSGLRLLIWF